MKLSKTQSELLQKLQSGETLHYIAYMGRYNPNAYFFCGATRCTKAADALIKKGVVERCGNQWKPEYRLKSKFTCANGAPTDAPIGQK